MPTLADLRRSSTHAGHQAIRAAVRAREADRAERLARAHSVGVRDAVLRAIRPSGVAALLG